MSPKKNSVPPKTLGQIEVMRIAALSGVFFFHLWSALPAVGQNNPFGPAFGAILSQGWMGVILFNIVSGFVLALPFAGPAGRPMPGYFAFLRRRFLRICPNYYIALIIWTLVAAVLGKGGPHLMDSFLWHASFLHSLNPNYFFDISPAYWWMGLLAQFYLAFPLLWRLYVKLGPKRAALWLILGAWGFWLALEFLAWLLPGSIFAMGNYIFYFNLPYRLPEFALGIYLACLWKDPAIMQAPAVESSVVKPFTALRRALWATFAALFAWGYFFGIPGPQLFVTHLYWCACVAVFGLLVFLHEPMARLGHWPPAAKIAAASYSVYLMHQPLLGYLAEVLRPYMHPFVAFVLLTAACVPASLWMARKLDSAVAKINARIG